MPRERVLITVKTYPTLSSKYGETVCTAGLREDGSWVRIYPVPFRRLEEIKRYRLFEWIECTLERNYKDFRPETFRIVDPSGLRRGRRVDTSEDWRERRESVLGKAAVYRRIETLVQAAKANEASLAVFKPTRVLDFVCRETEREWDPERLAQMRAMIDQGDLFDDNAWRSTFRVVDKVPYTFHYRFEDVTGRSATLQVLDWQIGALYRNCLRVSGGDESEALAKVREMYFDRFTQTDLHFFVGTTLRFQLVSPNPWMIVGVFPVPHEQQPDLFPLTSV